MNQNYYVGEPPTGAVYIGYERGRNDLRLFTKAEYAASWLENVPNGSVKYVWRYELTEPVAMEIVPAVRVDATLREKTDGSSS